MTLPKVTNLVTYVRVTCMFVPETVAVVTTRVYVTLNLVHITFEAC